MSRYKVNLVPGGAIPQDLDVGVTLNPEPPPAAPAFVPQPGFCVPDVGEPFIYDPDAHDWTLKEVSRFNNFQNSVYIKLLGQLCNEPVTWTISGGYAESDCDFIDGGILVFNAGSRPSGDITFTASFGGRARGSVTLHVVDG